jgi:hypothetical protein
MIPELKSGYPANSLLNWCNWTILRPNIWAWSCAKFNCIIAIFSIQFPDKYKNINLLDMYSPIKKLSCTYKPWMQNIHCQRDRHIQMKILHHCRQEMKQSCHQCIERCFYQQTNEWRSSQIRTGCTSPIQLVAIESEAQWNINFILLINSLLTIKQRIENIVMRLSLYESCKVNYKNMELEG